MGVCPTTRRRSIYHHATCPYQTGGVCECIEKNPYLTDKARAELAAAIAQEELENTSRAIGLRSPVPTSERTSGS